MQRQEFLKKGLSFLGIAAITPSILNASKDSINKAMDCVVTNSETAGPFPTITPSSLVQSNIVGDRTGIPLTINITIQNINNACNPLENAIVDIWHCDKDGYYSEYGGTPMQQVDYTAYHFLRGRQVTNSVGLVSFTSIFPGWYQSRATHIHVHIYSASGVSLLVTQIAFPEGTNSAVVQVNAATSYGYTKGMNGYTYNASDNVFSDGVTTEMSTISGSVSAGFTLDHVIKVNGGTSSIDSGWKEFTIGQNYPNPFEIETVIPLFLAVESKVTLQIHDFQGKLISKPIENAKWVGNKEIKIERKSMSAGLYFYKFIITNPSGTYEQSALMQVK